MYGINNLTLQHTLHLGAGYAVTVWHLDTQSSDRVSSLIRIALAFDFML